MSSKVWDLHHIEQCGLCEVLGPWLWDNLQIFPFSPGQILVQGKHSVSLPFAKVEVTELQRYKLILVSSNCTYPFQEVRYDQSIVKIFGHVVSVDGAS
jgi:hypothetical protein